VHQAPTPRQGYTDSCDSRMAFIPLSPWETYLTKCKTKGSEGIICQKDVANTVKFGLISVTWRDSWRKLSSVDYQFHHHPRSFRFVSSIFEPRRYSLSSERQQQHRLKMRMVILFI